MSSLLIGSSAQEAFVPGAAGPSWWARLARVITDAYRVRRAAAEMRSLDDRLLRDLGLDRGGVEYAVRFGRE